MAFLWLIGITDYLLNGSKWNDPPKLVEDSHSPTKKWAPGHVSRFDSRGMYVDLPASHGWPGSFGDHRGWRVPMKVYWLVVEPPIWKNMSQIGRFPQAVKNKKYNKCLKPPLSLDMTINLGMSIQSPMDLEMSTNFVDAIDGCLISKLTACHWKSMVGRCWKMKCLFGIACFPGLS